MPVAGRPRNPLAELPLRFRRGAYTAVAVAGETPGTMEHQRQGYVQAAGQFRRLYKQMIGLIPGAPDFSWSANAPAYSAARLFQITRALRYLATSLYLPAGADNTRYGAKRPYVDMENAMPRPTLGAGTRQNRPTVRNRLTSFGSRVSPLNTTLPATQADGQ